MYLLKMKKVEAISVKRLTKDLINEVLNSTNIFLQEYFKFV